MFRIPVVLMFVLTLCACASVRITPPEVELAGIEVRDASITHLNFDAQLRIYNPNRDTIEIGAVSYEMELNGERIFSSITYVDEPVGPGESIIVPLRVSSAFWDIIAMFSKLGTMQGLDFRLSGTVEAGPRMGRMASFDFERTGKIDLNPANMGGAGRGRNISPPAHAHSAPHPRPYGPSPPNTTPRSDDYI